MSLLVFYLTHWLDHRDAQHDYEYEIPVCPVEYAVQLKKVRVHYMKM